MIRITFQKRYLSGLKTVAFLAFALIFSFPVFSQEINLKSLKGDALFIGVDNLVEVSVEGIPSEYVFIGSDEVGIQKLENGQFQIQANNPGKITLLVHGQGFKHKTFVMDVKRIADPLAALKFENGAVKTTDEMTAEEFKKAIGIGFETGGFKGELSIEIASFSIVKVPKAGDPSEVPVNSANFNEKAKSLINSAVSGDTYYFEQVMSNVAGTPNQRKMNSLVFHIK